MTGLCLGVHTDISASLSPYIYICIHKEHVQKRIPCILLRVLGDTLPSYLPPGMSFLYFILFFFFSLLGFPLREYRARLAHVIRYIHRSEPDVNFLHAICRVPAYFSSHPVRRFAFHAFRLLRWSGPLIWKYSVTVIKDMLGRMSSPLFGIVCGIFEMWWWWSSVDEPRERE